MNGIEITNFRNKYHQESMERGIKLIPQLTILTHALDKYEPITLVFACSGSWRSFLELEVRGGPDNGKRVTTYPWYPEADLEYGATVYNGTREEYDRNIGYPARPSISHCGELHAVTVAAISQYLLVRRENRMAEHITNLYEKMNGT